MTLPKSYRLHAAFFICSCGSILGTRVPSSPWNLSTLLSANHMARIFTAAELISHKEAFPKKDRGGEGLRIACAKFSESGCHKLDNGVVLHGFVDV